jgi:hypothetical protein
MPRLWLVVVLGAIGVMELAQLPGAVDLAYHLKVGQLMVAEHALARTDVLAWTTAGRPWLDQNWGAELLLYGIWRLGGFPLLTVVSAALTVATWALVAAACRRRTANLRLVAGAVLAGYAVSAAAFSVRPQLFSLLLFATELYLLEVARARPRVALAVPLLMPLWANLHGAFVVGVGLLVIEALAAAWRRDRAASSPGRWSWARSACWWSPWYGRPPPAGCPSSCSGWRCLAGSPCGPCVGSPGSGSPSRSPCAPWPGSAPRDPSPPTAAPPRSACWCWWCWRRRWWRPRPRWGGPCSAPGRR